MSAANPDIGCAAAAGSAWLPLAGLRVLDFSGLLPGPYATVALADLGANVVKVEPPRGDPARQILKTMFRMANRNKRSIVVDLKNPAARAVVERLVRDADVVVEAFRPGVAGRLGIDHPALAAINPSIVYCSISGYGQTGPDRLRPGHDVTYLARSGALALAGHWNEPPRRSGLPIADIAGGSHAVIAILAALHARHATGAGAYVDLSLAETAMAMAALRHGVDFDGRTQSHVRPTNDLFRTADGQWIAIGIVEQHFWENFVRIVADFAPDLRDERFDSIDKRLRNGGEVSARLHALIGSRAAAYWLPEFERNDVPAELVLPPSVASRTAQVVAREAIAEKGGERHIPFPVHANGRRGARLNSTAPVLGSHTRPILEEAGFASAEIAALIAAGIVA
ncbi:MAG: CoA transferase [Betaproteobacteria bacterium]|nr:CoA transferase [Betaproteobacteria bacterium]